MIMENWLVFTKRTTTNIYVFREEQGKSTTGSPKLLNKGCSILYPDGKLP